MDKHSEDIIFTKEVVKKDVKSPSLEDLGEIKEIVLDKASGQVRYVALGFGGFLGLGENYFAFPWEALHYNKDEDCFILDVSKDQLKAEDGFDKDHWPSTASLQKIMNKYHYIATR